MTAMAISDAPAWHFWIDRGGTFTDVVARRPDGSMATAKLLSDDPNRIEDAAVAAIRKLTGVASGPLPHCNVRMGTTVATNALLERTGEPTLLAITQGYADALTIGTQERPDIFARAIRLTPPPHAAVVEIDERVTATGEILCPLDEERARASLAAAYAEGLRAIAIVLMHGWRWTAHEERLAIIAAAVGFTQISVSSQTSALIKLIGRGDTTLADATLTPVLRHYVDGFRSALGDNIDPLFMQSSGGLTDHRRFRGKDAILSGPAGGIVAMARTAAAVGATRIIGFDMGGTSTDVSHYAGRYERDEETVVAGTRIRAAMLRIHTIAAGGGSICRWDGARLHVGPQSAGAVPGPAAYRNGGPLTITDCNIMLGKIQAEHFPKIFGPQGDAPIDTDLVHAQFAAMAAQITASTGRVMTANALAEGFIAIAVANMANAIKRISVGRGHDVTRDYALVCFGGAGGQHACLVADALGINEVLIHPLAGVLSAYGMGLAQRSSIVEQTVSVALSHENERSIKAVIQALEGQALAQLAVDSGETARTEAMLFVREAGSENCIELVASNATAVALAFAAAFRQQFGYAHTGALVIERVRVEAIADDKTQPLTEPPTKAGQDATMGTATCTFTDAGAGATHACAILDRAKLHAGFCAAGPLIIIDPSATTVVEPGWQVRVEDEGTMRLTRSADGSNNGEVRFAESATPDPIRLEIFNALFMAIAEEMGSALQRSASSVNIRERLDFSCALFAGDGSLVANAPHMPVHLGSMGESVRTILHHRGQWPDGTPIDGRGIRPGDAYALNAPYEGGTHLPDITVIMPVFVSDAASPAFFVAARGHHADIGGIAPGSMPPNSRSVEEEGIVIDNMLIVEDGRLCEDALFAKLTSGSLPSRNPALNIADIKAQLAACARGAAGVQQLCADHGMNSVTAYMAHGQAQAEGAVRRLIGRLSDGSFRYAMDNGAVVCVAVRVDHATRSVTIDFTGTSAALPDNFNAPLPVVRAAVLYVLRTMIDEPIPMNDGCLAPVTLIVPPGSMLSPIYPAAVVAGNVETSQVVTDALFGAFGAMAASQGTMNNFTFGNDAHQYYETIAGGAGAGPDFDGASAVQTHMTNSRLTDPEILESRFPVLLEEFSIRRGSGGQGAHRGGDGVVRRIRFLEPMSAGILSNRRRVAPFGLGGGSDGTVGVNRMIRNNGNEELFDATAQVMVDADDVMIIETPGGGGYGGA